MLTTWIKGRLQKGIGGDQSGGVLPLPFLLQVTILLLSKTTNREYFENRPASEGATSLCSSRRKRDLRDENSGGVKSNTTRSRRTHSSAGVWTARTIRLRNSEATV